jgi:replication factor C subunit 1
VITDNSCLIMDEVDGMSAGDRGGVGALNALIKKSKVTSLDIQGDDY